MSEMVTLPNYEDMLQRLLEVSDDQIYQDGAYPALLQYADATVRWDQFNALLIEAIICNAHNVSVEWVIQKIPEFTYALIDDLAVAKNMVKMQEYALRIVRAQRH